MHFHLPKPLHGWREFAGEVGIIVVGVLIALTAEQLVETIHWRHELDAERGSLLQEANDSFAGVAARAAQQACVDRRLRDIRTLLERHHSGEPLGITGEIGIPTRLGATRGSWEIAIAGQALTHMPHDEKLAFSDVFGSFDIWEKVSENENATWRALAPLNIAELLTEEDWSRIRTAYSEALIANDHVRLLAPWMLKKRLPGLARYRSAGDLSDFSAFASKICKPILRS